MSPGTDFLQGEDSTQAMLNVKGIHPPNGNPIVR